nr:hypothetical protein Iba_chr09aCG11840 [Ipomoea batatas]
MRSWKTWLRSPPFLTLKPLPDTWTNAASPSELAIRAKLSQPRRERNFMLGFMALSRPCPKTLSF